MFHLTQYIVVRRDIPMENVVVYAAHAAGKASFWQAVTAMRSRAPACDDLTMDWGFPSRIVRGSKNEARLLKLRDQLEAARIPYTVVVEPDDGPFKGQMMALALMFGERAQLEPYLKDFQNLRFKDVPDFIARGGRPE